jgi:hypothetical protein
MSTGLPTIPAPRIPLVLCTTTSHKPAEPSEQKVGHHPGIGLAQVLIHDDRGVRC